MARRLASLTVATLVITLGSIVLLGEIVLMLISDRKQGLTDHILGTAAINRAAAG